MTSIGSSLRERLHQLSTNTFQELPKEVHPTNLHGGPAHLHKRLKRNSSYTPHLNILMNSLTIMCIPLKEIKSMIKAAQAKHDQQLIDKFNANPKALYGYMRDMLGLKPKIGQVM